MSFAPRASLALLALAACRSAPAPGPEPAAAAAEFLPTPYTAEQIRDAFPSGSAMVYRTEEAGAVTLTTTRFQASDGEGTQLETIETQPDGTPIGEPKPGRARWTELRDHAKFPVVGTAVSDAELTDILGLPRVPCWLYVVSADGKDGPTETRMYFAKELAGPPLVWEVWASGVKKTAARMIELRSGERHLVDAGR